MTKKIAILLLGLLLSTSYKGLAAEDQKILIDMHYLVISPAEDGSTNMMNMVNYTNSSKKEYTGDGKGEAVLQVTLPLEAKDLNFLDNKIAFKQVDKGFITTTPIPANQTMVLPYSYRMPKDKEIRLSVDYPVKTMQILVPEGRGSIEVKGIQSINQGFFKFEDQNYWGYSIEGIKAKQAFTIVYNKNVQPAADSGKQLQAENVIEGNNAVTHTAPAFHNPGHLRMWAQSPLHRFNPHVFLIIIGSVIIAGISYYAYFRRKARLEEEKLGADKEEKTFKLLMTKQKTIMDKIIELEETFGNGKLSEAEYQARLDAYKQHLIQVKLRIRDFID
ncbi:hypothetical protein [Neobacillus kokaensis]|uniref:Uncharacterized protein n=1 Tax=Neobacillus kokaensis TaxID=2759023 RepID=A0ABQ3NAX0_9BACI|nr:hypothetical protein [Neobacillus kokaensis]GHI01007.1 hypothetical protein AM1BK_45490 [Neobacillus kokaensis]